MLNSLKSLRTLFKKDAKVNKGLKDQIAELLKTTPEALEAFEKSYRKYALSDESSNNLFDISSKQISKMRKEVETLPIDELQDKVDTLVNRIVEELLLKSKVYYYDGVDSHADVPKLKKGFELSTFVTNDDLSQLPKSVKPQLTGKLMTIDIDAPTYQAILSSYINYINTGDMRHYWSFRQGMDILDLDDITYNILSNNPNSMGNWLPQLVDANLGKEFFKIPKTKILKVPLSLLQLTRIEYTSLTSTTMKILNKYIMKVFGLNVDNNYFIKTGTYSSKFDFRNAKVTKGKEVTELGEYLLYIHFSALSMAHFTVQPHPIVGVSTTNEWVVREFIEDVENNATIYKGMPLHTEYRVFVDCDDDTVIGVAPYWDPKIMKDRFSNGEDQNSPHQIHDYINYVRHEEELMSRYYDNVDNVVLEVKRLLPDLNLEGQWSIDIMQNGDDFWLIDMAKAGNSALSECVPKHLLKDEEENWFGENNRQISHLLELN